MTDPDPTLEALAAQLTAGERVEIEAIPQRLREHPDILRLLGLARVLHQLHENLESGPGADREPDGSAPERLGPFRLVRVLGTGGMGEVWLGERVDGEVEQRVAIKRVRGGDPRLGERMRGERRILARLEHPNIAHFIDAGMDDLGTPWLALEYVDGVPLTDWCQQRNLDLPARLRLFTKVCAAVEHAHRHLVVHRDLKPSNILVNRDGEAKLLDFGIARLVDGSDTDATQSGLTPSYAAPEQLRGGPISTATDVYALGLVLFRLLAGKLPQTRTGDNLAQVLARLDDEETERPSRRAAVSDRPLPYPSSALAGDLDAIVAQALRADPARRYGSPAALANDIERHLDSRPVQAREPTRRYRMGRYIRRHRVAVGFAVLALVALLGGTAIALDQAARARLAATEAEREAQMARQAQARTLQTLAFLESLFREQDPFSRASSNTRSSAQLLADGVTRVLTELEGDPEGQLRLLLSLSEAQYGQGLALESSATLALATARLKDLGEPPALAAQHALLAARLDEAGLRTPAALEHYAQAEALAASAHGIDSLERARIRREQARALASASQLPAAAEAAEEAHALFLSQLGESHPETALARYQLGLVREQKREDAAALADFQSAVSVLEQAYGATDARLILPLMSLGERQRQLRQFDAARTSLQRGTAVAAAQLGTRHVQHAAVLQRLGMLERDAGDLDAAAAALDAAEAALPDGEVSALAQLLAIRGSIHLSRGDAGAAEPDLRRAMQMRHDGGGRSSGLAWFSQAEWARALAELGRVDEAERLLRESRRELSTLLGPEAYQNSLIAARLATVLSQRGRHEEAAAELAEAERLVIEHGQAGPAEHNALQYRVQRAQNLAHLPARRAEARQLLATIDQAVAQSEGLEQSLQASGLTALRQELARE